MKKKVLALSCCFALALTGCGSGGATGSSSEIEFQSEFTIDQEPFQTLSELTNKFNEENKDVKVKIKPAGANNEEDLKVRLASNNPPDLFQTHGWSLNRYKEFLEPLNDEPWATNFSESLDESMRDADGKFYAMPVDAAIAGIPYNVDVLKEAGVDVAEINTWEDFTNACEKIKKIDKTCIASSAKTNEYPGNMADWMLATSYNETQQEQLKKGEPVREGYTKAMETVDLWRTKGFFNEDYSSATGDDIARMLADNEAAFTFKQNVIIPTAEKYNPEANLQFMPIPAYDGKKFLYGGEGSPIGLSKTSKNKDVAKKYLTFLAEPDNAAKISESIGNMPGLKNVKSDLGKLEPSFNKWVTEEHLKVYPYFDRVVLPNGMWNTLITTTDSIITGQQKPEQATDQFVTQFESLYGQKA